MKISRFGTGSGQLVSGSNNGNILSLNVLEIQKLFKSSGMILFRDFNVTDQTFPAFVDLFTSQFLIDHGNSKKSDPAGGFVQSVTIGSKPIELHCENATSAERPDIIGFYCAAPAVSGGETTVCDGVAVWNELSNSTKQSFLNKKVRYTITVPREVYLNKDKEIVLRVGSLKLAGTTYRFNDDDSLTIEYVVSAVNKTKYGYELAFANSLTGPYPDYKKTFEDRSEIPEAMFHEIRGLHEKLTEKIPWQAGDLVMIDNSRFLHGRCAFNDQQRRLFTLMSLANF
jgi:alpha-ketoglutarate-dependent taurine dioxygenase